MMDVASSDLANCESSAFLSPSFLEFSLCRNAANLPRLDLYNTYFHILEVKY